MSLSLALNNALSGLRVNQESIGVLSNNIANVNTVGYSRQVVNQSAVDVAGVGSGVQIDDITRKIDKYLQRSLQSQASANANAQTMSDYYERLQNLLGKPGTSNSIDTSVTSFFNSVQQLAETPQTNSLKSSAVASAVSLTKQISALAGNVQDLRSEADKAMGDAIGSINASLDRLTDINKALTQAKQLGQTTAGLLDARDRELGTISGFMNISTSFTDTGAVSVIGGDGVVLVEEGIRHQLTYTKASSVNTFIQDGNLAPVQDITLDSKGVPTGNPVVLITGGKSSQITSKLSGGSLAALQQMRDKQFPAILDQLDQLAAKLRDSANSIHNQGSSYPPATSLTGDRLVKPSSQSSWTGTVRIAVLQADGTPVPSTYADESYTGIQPLTLDLSRLNSGFGGGAGQPSVQTIIDEINNHFGAPGNKAELGNLNNIQLASDTNLLPSGAPPLFNFDLDLQNISSSSSQVFVTGMSVKDSLGANITNVTKTAPSMSILGTNSYVTTMGSADVTINLATPPNVNVGDKIYLNAPSAAVNGISQANLTGFFTVTSVSGNAVTFTSNGTATSSGPVNDGGNIQAMAAYDSVAAGAQERTQDKGQLQVDLSGNVTSAYYDVTVNVSVVDAATGTISSAPITYRVMNNVRDNFNARYDATAVGAPGKLVIPQTSQSSLRAIMVDANGQELPKFNGKYADVPGYLAIVGGNATGPYGVAIDEMNSMEVGDPNTIPAQAGTNWGFSHYFGLNNLFNSNALTSTGDTVKGSASSLSVQDRLIKNPNLISTATLSAVSKSAATNNKDVYTYAIYNGDNSVVQKLAGLNTQGVSFDAAGGLPASQQSLLGYTTEVLGSISQSSAQATDGAANAKTLYDGFASRSQSESGVNLDEELANTVVFQNAYSATARVITTVNKMYDDLLQVF